MQRTSPTALRASVLVLSLIGASVATDTAVAQSASPAAGANEWKYKSKHLTNAEIDALLAKPERVLVVDVRRPDEHITYGSFPVFLSVQASELESRLAYLPKDRTIVTVSNHAGRAGAAADLLASKGYTVAGAAGSEDYEKAGGTAVRHVRPAQPAQAASAAAALTAAR